LDFLILYKVFNIAQFTGTTLLRTLLIVARHKRGLVGVHKTSLTYLQFRPITFYAAGRFVLTIEPLSSIDDLQSIWSLSKSYQFYVAVGSAGKDPHSRDKLSNLAESRHYFRNAFPPYGSRLFF
jgi:hypothetical protein